MAYCEFFSDSIFARSEPNILHILVFSTFFDIFLYRLGTFFSASLPSFFTIILFSILQSVGPIPFSFVTRLHLLFGADLTLYVLFRITYSNSSSLLTLRFLAMKVLPLGSVILLGAALLTITILSLAINFYGNLTLHTNLFLFCVFHLFLPKPETSFAMIGIKVISEVPKNPPFRFFPPKYSFPLFVYSFFILLIF